MEVKFGGMIKNLVESEKFHCTFIRYILKMRTNTCNAMVYGESGRFPVAIMIKMMIGFWSRLLTGKSTKLVKLIYNCVNRQRQ